MTSGTQYVGFQVAGLPRGGKALTLRPPVTEPAHGVVRMSMNFEQARHNMVEQQVRPWEVFEPRVLELLEKIHREDFVPARYRKLALADLEIPLPEGQRMMKPLVEARMLQALDIQPGEHVLEIGTGSSFITACLHHLGGEVLSVELHPALHERAARKLSDAGIPLAAEGTAGVELLCADALRPDFIQGRLFDVVVVTGAVWRIPEHFKHLLKLDGRLFAIEGEPPVMEAALLRRVGEAEWESRFLFETELDWLQGAEKPTNFKLQEST